MDEARQLIGEDILHSSFPNHEGKLLLRKPWSLGQVTNLLLHPRFVEKGKEHFYLHGSDTAELLYLAPSFPSLLHIFKEMSILTQYLNLCFLKNKHRMSVVPCVYIFISWFCLLGGSVINDTLVVKSHS